MEELFLMLNNSKVLAGLAIMFMNIGSRYLHLDFPKSLDYLFKNQLLRIFVVLSIIFITIRDIKLSILLTLIYILLVKVLLNEKSRACILPKHYIDLNNDGDITKEEIIKAKQVLTKYKEKMFKD